MNRRDLVKGLFALPALAALGEVGGCDKWWKHCSAPDGSKLCVILNGPFGLVLRKGKGARVTAFVPKADPRIPHEFRFGSPNNSPCDPKSSYHYELLSGVMEAAGQEPQIDRGFDNVLLPIPHWEPDPDNYFVSLDLPVPDAVRYLPPLIPALFDSDYDNADRLGSAPVNLILEYRVCDEKELRLKQASSQKCGTDRDDLSPLKSDGLQSRYREYHSGMSDQAPSFSQRRYVPRLAQYSYAFFFGVGLPPINADKKDYWDWGKSRWEHGVSFFNEKLLSAIYQGKQPPPGSKLKKLGKDVLQCEGWHEAASTENCTSPVVIGKLPAVK